MEYIMAAEMSLNKKSFSKIIKKSNIIGTDISTTAKNIKIL